MQRKPLVSLSQVLASIESDPDSDFHVVVGIRHGQKESGSGDVALTSLGCQQAVSQFRHLKDKGINPGLIAASGALRTRQMARIATGVWSQDPSGIIVEPRFHFQALADKHCPGNPRAVLEEASLVKAAGGNVAKALEMSIYARDVREQVTQGILALVGKMLRSGEGGSQHVAVFFSHSPCFECAAVDTENTPYGVGECDAVAWVVLDNSGDDVGQPEIISSWFLPAPMPGAANV